MTVGADDPVLFLDGHPRYRPERVLSTGSYGIVVQALDVKEDKLVALKFIKRAQVAADDWAEMEVLGRLRLDHPHLLKLHEVFTAGDSLVLVMEFAPGGNLGARCESGKGMPEGEARWLFQQILFALDYCHRVGVATRDIKLENIMAMDDSSRPIIKLADMGLSTKCKGAGLAQCDGVAGTPKYFAPELLEHVLRGKPYDPKKGDVWACGILLYIILTGCCPFQRPSDTRLDRRDRMLALLQRMKQADFALPAELSSDCKDLLTCLLVPDPIKRPTIQDLLHHPWCAGGLSVKSVLQCNDVLFKQTLEHPTPAKIIHEARQLVKEASKQRIRSCRSQGLMHIPEEGAVEELEEQYSA